MLVEQVEGIDTQTLARLFGHPLDPLRAAVRALGVHGILEAELRRNDDFALERFEGFADEFFGAIEVFTRYAAAEFAGRRIRANCVAPGALDTDFGGGRTDQQRKAIGEHTLMGRIGTADDIGPVIASVLSDDNGWVNAQRIEATGGTAG